LKILIISFSFPPQVNGVAEVAQTQARGFAARGHDVTVATKFDEARDGRRTSERITVRQFKISGAFEARTGYCGELEAYQRCIAQEPVDIILINCWQNPLTDLAIPVLFRNPGKKIMLSHGFDAHIWRPNRRPSWGLGSWLRYQPYVWRLPSMMKAFDRLVFLSTRRDSGRFLDHWVAQRLFPGRVSIIPNGTHLFEFGRSQGDFRNVYGIETKYMFLNVANYCHRKNQLATLRDFMAANWPEATLVFIGGEFNDYQAEMTRTYARCRTRFPQSRVMFLEKVPKRMIYAAYQAADALILGAKTETQPLAILDAMAAGIPFISSDVGCVRDFPGGLVVRHGADTTRAIVQVLEDSSLRERLSAEGRAACETKYNWERVLDAYEALFTRLALHEGEEKKHDVRGFAHRISRN
jgi:glycosyltransferase involved in cell wall biosynthesis